MNTISITRYMPGNGHKSSLSSLFRGSKNLKRRSNKTTSRRMPMLKSRMRGGSDTLSWVAGAGAVALAGAGIAYAAKKFGGGEKISQLMGRRSADMGRTESRHSAQNKYPTEHASAGGMMPETPSSGHS